MVAFGFHRIEGLIETYGADLVRKLISLDVSELPEDVYARLDGCEHSGKTVP